MKRSGRSTELDEFIHQPEKIGQPYLGKYTVCTASGTTGQPAILLQDGARTANARPEEW